MPKKKTVGVGIFEREVEHPDGYPADWDVAAIFESLERRCCVTL